MAGIQLLWFKRDLRVRDHAALQAAAAAGPILPVYVIEPELWRQPDSSARHWQWLRSRLPQLDRELHALGISLSVLYGEIVETFRQLHGELGIAGVFSHEEVGNAWTFARDQRLAAWLGAHGIPWREFPQDGVLRPHPNRDAWQAQRDRYMHAALIPAPETVVASVVPHGTLALDTLPTATDLGLQDAVAEDFLPVPTADAAQSLLDRFIDEKYLHYLGGMSSPLSAAQQCSRLSPYLAIGIYSTRQAVQKIAQQQKRCPHRGLRGLQSRLAWRGHFMQKLEDEPRIEFENLHRALDGLRENEFNRSYFDAWQRGETGFPMVDACMRYLQRGGWLNFRMRAMLVSFSAYALWLHWLQPALHLARLFVDYEPGIHYPQVQMQAGTTGINALRIYNVDKQGQELDPEGIFIRRWVPELAQIPAPWIHQPWSLPRATAGRYGLILDQTYPAPIVSLALASRQARSRVYAARRETSARAEAQQILHRHGSRKRGRRTPRKAEEDERQLELF